jgi:DnaJ-class molecular chaperone
MSPYMILGVAEGAPLDVVKSAYRKLVKKYHPDVNPDEASKMKFQEVQQAYDAITAPPPRPQQPPRPQFNFTTVHQVMIQVDVTEAFHGGRRNITMNTPFGESIEISIEIPPMSIPGTRLKVNGLPSQLDAVDLYVIIMTGEDGPFRAMGTTIMTRINVDFTTAILGGEVSVETLDGIRYFSVPAGSQPGAMVKLANLGFVIPGDPNGTRDDFVVFLDFTFPTSVTVRQREMLEQYRALGLTS